MWLYIKTSTGKTITIQVKPSETISNIKAIIQDKESIPPDKQHLTFENNLLDDNSTLSDYNLPKKATLQLDVTEEMGTLSSTGFLKKVLY